MKTSTISNKFNLPVTSNFFFSSIYTVRSGGQLTKNLAKNPFSLLSLANFERTYFCVNVVMLYMFHNIEQNIRICAAYNPPSSSKYFNKNVIEHIGEDIIEAGNNYPIILIGDINARVGKLSDYMINYDNDLVPSILVSEIFHPKTERKNCDNQVNKEGIKLIEMCKALDMMILNGRTNGDYFGRITHYNKYQGSSTVDLAAVSCNIFEYISSFMVMPQLDITDHCKIITKLNNIININKEDRNNSNKYNWLNMPNSFKWDKDTLDIFKQTLRENKDIEKIIIEAEQRLEAGLIESTGTKIQEIFMKTADICLLKKENKINENKEKYKKKKKSKNGMILNVKT